MRIKLLLFSLCFFSLGQAFAQTDSNANFEDANVIVYKDSRLYELDARPEALENYMKNKKAIDAKAKKDAYNDSLAKELPKMKAIVKNQKTVTGSIVNRPGFRVNIFNGNDKAKAMATKAAFMRAYPSYRTYVSYNVPYYKIRVGDFEDKKQAQAFMKKINAAFPGCFIVPDVVTVKNIIVQ